MKRKRLRVIRKGAVVEGELPKVLTRQGPKWLKSWPKVRLIRSRVPRETRWLIPAANSASSGLRRGQFHGHGLRP
jgi:hypothetical protein